MMPTSLLPALITAAIVLVVVSVIAGLALVWTADPQTRRLIQRSWIVVAVLTVLGIVVFWIGTAMIGGGAPVDRSMQQQQQDDLQKRLDKGGH